ncbi:MAG: hypothetical protein ACK2UJ_11540 [Candidatus Promineifilaceae bacterium]
MRSPRQLFVILVGVGLFFLFYFGNSPGERVVLLAEEATELAFLPVIFSPPLEITATPTTTISPTESVTPEATESATLEVTASATAEPSQTPTATATVTPSATATATATATETAQPSETPSVTLTPGVGEVYVYLPVVAGPPVPVLEVPVPVSKEPPIDFDAERAKAQEAGQDLAFNKIGFHILQFGTRAGLLDYIEAMDAAGVPVVLKTANDAEYLFKTQELAKVSGVEHVLIYRDATFGRDIPDYNLDPKTAALKNWAENRRVFPPELDPAMVWMETTNEPDRTRAAWLAEFALVQAETAVREGARYAAFGWAAGEPERAHWESPEMLDFLRYAADHPDQVAVALHEYSFKKDDIGNDYPSLIGRFQTLFDVCDQHGIPRPTVLITEWGWEYNQVPGVEDAMDDIRWASWLYAAYPQVKGAAIWTLGIGGGEFGSIGEKVQQYLAPVTDYSLGNFFLYSPGTRMIDSDALAPPEGPATPTPTPTTTPTLTPTPNPDNGLNNGSFEKGWETIAFGNQRPNFWQLSWVQPGDPLYDSTDVATGICECVHKLKDQLPPEEQPGGSDPLILDGVVTYKMFSASQSFGTQLSQTASGLTPGAEYRLSVPLRLHKYGETDPFGAEAGVWVDDVGDWSNVDDMPDRAWCRHELTFTAPADGSVEIDIRVKSKYPSTKDFFMDDFRLGLASEPDPHPDIPLCDPTPELERYRPVRRLSWLGT